MAKCFICGENRRDISGFLKICGSCVKEGSKEAIKLIQEAHHRSRTKFGLPGTSPKAPNGLKCERCGNE